VSQKFDQIDRVPAGVLDTDIAANGTQADDLDLVA
jgi:hypothetical protein